VYNVKEEAMSVAPRGADPISPDSPLTSPDSLSGRPISVSAPVALSSAERVHDIFAEWDTMETVNAVRDALEERCVVEMIEANEESFEKFRKGKIDFVFNIAEGLHGVSRESQIPAMLELLGIPYLGSDPLTLGLCLDKARAKEILHYHGIPTAPFNVVHAIDELDDVRLRFPSIVKPLHEGSSKGVYDSSVVRNPEELEREVRAVLDVYHEPALIEEFLTGREFTAALMGNDDSVEVLPIVEIRFDALPAGANPIYSYEAKWVWDSREKPLEIFECPAPLDTALKAEIESMCKRAYRVLRCRDWARIDLRCDAKGQPRILELNPLPGILPKPEDNSCFPKAARAAGMSYHQLINRVLDIALARHGISAPKAPLSRPGQN
jgi:D-alanine-D-alanine ligase